MNICKPFSITSLILVLGLAGCMVGPDFQSPATESPAQWAGAPGAESKGASIPVPGQPPEMEWWKVFKDPVLESLTQQAVGSNLDLQQAEARVKEARAARAVAAAGFFPEVDATSQFRRSNSISSNSISSGSGTSGSGAFATGGGGGPRNFYQAGFDSIWELDVFGGIRRNIEAADADLAAAVEGQRGVFITLMAEVALNYVQLRGAQKELAVARANVVIQEKSVAISRERFNAGFVSYLDVANADAQVATTRALIPVFESSIRQSIYTIGVLLGGPPAAPLEQLLPAQPIPGVPPQVPVGLPSELLQRRPDIRQAEAQLHAAVARVGVATADLFPKFSLTSAFGFGSDTLSTLTHDGHRLWSLAPGVTWPLFTGGRLSAEVDVFRAQADQALLTYKQTVLGALKEVEIALVAYTTEQQRRSMLARAVAANKTAVDLASKLYAAGQTDFLNVISAKRQLFDSETALTQSEQVISTDLIALYKALGGGWEVAEAGKQRK